MRTHLTSFLLLLSCLVGGVAAGSSDLLYANGFESSDPEPPAMEFHVPTVPAAIHSKSAEAPFGNGAYYLETPDAGNWLYLVKNFPAKDLKGKRLRLSAWIKSAVPGRARLILTNGEPWNVSFHDATVKTPTGTDWERVTIEVERKPGADGGFALGLDYYSAGMTMLVDNLRFECADSFPPLPDEKPQRSELLDSRLWRQYLPTATAFLASLERDRADGVPVDPALYEPLQASIAELEGPAIRRERAEALSELLARRIAWETVEPSTLFQERAGLPTDGSRGIDFSMARGGYDAAVVLLRNNSGRSVRLKPEWSSAQLAAPTLRAMLPVMGSFDALPEIRPDEIVKIGDGETAGVWLDFRPNDAAPGIHAGSLRFRALDEPGLPEIEVPVRLKIADLTLPEEVPAAVFTCDYNTSEGQAVYAYLRRSGVNVFHVKMPDFSTDPDWANSGLGKLIDRIEANGDRGKVKLFIENWFVRDHGGWKEEYAPCFRGMVAYLRSRGWDYPDWILHIYDEILSDEFLRSAQAIRNLDPKIRIFSDLLAADVEKMRSFAPYVDYWCPIMGALTNPEDADALAFIRSTGLPIWVYQCDATPVHPLEFYRRLPWTAAQYKLQGIFAWTMAPCQLIPARDNINYGMTYTYDDGTLYPSRRWALWELGLNDYKLLHALAAAGKNPDEGIAEVMKHTAQSADFDRAIRAWKNQTLAEF